MAEDQKGYGQEDAQRDTGASANEVNDAWDTARQDVGKGGSNDQDSGSGKK